MHHKESYTQHLNSQSSDSDSGRGGVGVTVFFDDEGGLMGQYVCGSPFATTYIVSRHSDQHESYKGHTTPSTSWFIIIPACLTAAAGMSGFLETS